MPAQRWMLPGRVADRHALREDGVVLAVDAHHAVLAIPVVAGARAFLPGGHGFFDVVGMQDAAPAIIRRLLLRQADQAAGTNRWCRCCGLRRR